MWCLVVHSLDHSVRIRLDTLHVFCAQTRARSHACDNIFCSRCICLLLACSPRGKKKQKKTVISAGYSPRHFLWEMVNKRRPWKLRAPLGPPKTLYKSCPSAPHHSKQDPVVCVIWVSATSLNRLGLTDGRRFRAVEQMFVTQKSLSCSSSGMKMPP